MLLDGITRKPFSKIVDVDGMIAALENPAGHSPLRAKNRIKMRVVGPKGNVKQEIDHIENIMCTFGLNRLCELIATGGEASDWISAYGIGTDTTAANSTQDALGASTGSVALSATTNMNVTDQGNLTLRYLATFLSNNPAGAAEIHEVGLFCAEAASAEMAARAVLGASSVNKGASDQIQISHDVIFTTA